jgi:hypothetical protein
VLLRSGHAKNKKTAQNIDYLDRCTAETAQAGNILLIKRPLTQGKRGPTRSTAVSRSRWSEFTVFGDCSVCRILFFVVRKSLT